MKNFAEFLLVEFRRMSLVTTCSSVWSQERNPGSFKCSFRGEKKIWFFYSFLFKFGKQFNSEFVCFWGLRWLSGAEYGTFEPLKALGLKPAGPWEESNSSSSPFSWGDQIERNTWHFRDLSRHVLAWCLCEANICLSVKSHSTGPTDRGSGLDWHHGANRRLDKGQRSVVFV